MQKLGREFVPWKALQHPNVLPLLGVIMTETTFAMVSEWMPNGNINQFVTAHQDANRFNLVSSPPRLLQPLPVTDNYIAPVVMRRRRGPDLYAVREWPTGILKGCVFKGWTMPFFLTESSLRRAKCSDCYALGMVIYEVLRRRKSSYRIAQRDLKDRMGQSVSRMMCGRYWNSVGSPCHRSARALMMCLSV